ncbi:YbbR domain-containing protein [Alicyclobacillus hesperidum]|uniref:YbbR domain-containing protein n=1 Tax=Alicyclobacillus hesperidum TaxID=89784 RepID=A0A1H2VM60_9BACL|nr:CdaR family protein [Alicyclobacillus hesperidum]SDW69378.1 YbbR domain-containing protein [Alicyclobacillus hesperidum]
MMDRFLRNTTALRILALVLACILWLAVHAPQGGSNQDKGGVTQTYPLSVHIETSNDMVVTSPEPSATVRVTTSLLRVPSLPADMLKAQLVANAQGLGPGTETLHVAAINMPSGIRSYSISPATITVVLEQKETVQRSVSLQVIGTPQVGYTLGQFNPGAIAANISGAASAVRSVKHIVGTVDITGLSQTTTKVVQLEPVDASGRVVQSVSVSPASISVTVPIAASTEAVNLTPVITGTPAPGYAVAGVTLATTQVTEVGLSAAQLPKAGLDVPVDVNNLSHDVSISVPVPLKQGMTSVSPPTVTAVVQIEPSATLTLQKLPIQVQGGNQASLTGVNSVDVVLSGPESVLRAISQNPSQVYAYVDASKAKSGTASLPIQVHVPAYVDVVNLSVRSAQVAIQ